jgi:hypothetical protein
LLPTVSDNGINGTWNPAVVSDQASGTYTFTAGAGQGPCIATVVFTVTVSPILTPTFNFGNLSICIGASVPALPATSLRGISGT